MKRRDVLATTAVLVSTGCLGGNTGNDDGGGTDGSSSGTETPSNTSTTGTETDAGGTAEPTTGTETETTVETAQLTSTTTETTTNGTPDTPIPVPDRLTDHRKDTPLTGEAHVTFADSDSRVVVSGTIVGHNGCQTAVLDSVEETNSGLVITVATERNAPADAVCSMALVEIEYRFAVPIENPPESVTVVHRSAGGKRTITTATRG